MNPQQNEAGDYIKTHLQQGFSKAQIYEHFIAHGWNIQQIDQAFNLTEQPVPNTAAPFEPPQNAAGESVPNKYRVTAGIWDATTAIASRPLEYFGAAIISIAAFCILIILPVLIFTSIASLEPIGGGQVLLILLYIAWIVAVYVVVSTFFMAATAKLLVERSISFKKSLQIALRTTPKASLAYCVGFLITFGPILVGAVGGVIAALATIGGSSTAISVIFILLFFLGFVWALIASLRLALVQQVAVFEPDLPFRKVFGRSSFLLRKGGQWFLVKGICLLFVIIILMSVVTGMTLNELEATENLAVNLVFAVMTLLTQTVLTMLYHNRSVVRTAPSATSNG